MSVKFSVSRNQVIPFLLIAANTAYAATSSVLEEVVVTAQRRAQSTQDVPVAITGLSGDQVEKFGLNSASDVSAQVPNMQVSSPFGDIQPIFSIRGVSMSDYSSNQASPIGVYVDEAYLGPVYTHGSNFFDVERLEVLRGPQGTLYGKNTTGGAINIITRRPEFQGDNGNIKVGAGSYGATVLEGALEKELVADVLAMRISGSYKRDDGYEDIVGRKQNGSQVGFKGGRIALRWQPNDSWDFTFRFTRSGNDALSSVARNEARTDLRGTGMEGDSNGFIDYDGYSRGSRNLDFHETEANSVGPLITNTRLGTFVAEYSAESYTITSVSAYYDADYDQDVDTDASPNHMLEVHFTADAIGYSQDLRIASSFTGFFNIIAGVYFGAEDQGMYNRYSVFEDSPDTRVGFSKPDTAPFYPYLVDYGILAQKMDTSKQSAAIYSQMRFDFTSQFGMDLGLRYTRDESDLDYLNISRIGYDGSPRGTYVPGNTTGKDEPYVALPLTPNGLAVLLNDPQTLADLANAGYTHGPYNTDSAPKLKAKEGEWTGKLGVDYRLNESWMVYASYSLGYRAGSYNGGVYYLARPLATAYAAPEYIKAWEAGFKADLFEQRMRLNAAAFYYDYKDQQFLNLVGFSQFLENAGGSTIAGVEAELWARVTERLTLQVGLGYLKTEYTELTLANTETIADSTDEIDLSGNELIYAPKLNTSISADYDVLMTDWGVLTLNLNGNFQGDQWFSAYNDDAGYGEIRQDAYWLYNARLSWFANDDRYAVALWVKNLLDKEYDVYGLNLQPSFGHDNYMGGKPRSWGAEVTFRF